MAPGIQRIISSALMGAVTQAALQEAVKGTNAKNVLLFFPICCGFPLLNKSRSQRARGLVDHQGYVCHQHSPHENKLPRTEKQGGESWGVGREEAHCTMPSHSLYHLGSWSDCGTFSCRTMFKNILE